MKTRLFSAILLLAFFSSLSTDAATRPKDVYGWDIVRWGMSSAEVEKILGADIEKRKTRVDEKENMYSDLLLSNIKIGNLEFRASLWMDMQSNRLVRVVFVPESEPSKYQWAEAFISIENYLIKMYGNPDVKKTSNDPGTSADRLWIFPSTEIELSYLWLGDSELLLLVFSYSGDLSTK